MSNNWDELIKQNNLMLVNWEEAGNMDDPKRTAEYKQKYADARAALRSAIEKVEQERDKLKWDYDECMRQYDHQQERACNAEAALQKANDMAALLYKTNASGNACTIYENYRSRVGAK
jgi:hypothetical protein